MPQVGWLVRNSKGEYIPRSHEAVMEYADTYPERFPYTRQMVERMVVATERDYISATMIAGCPREMAIRILDTYGWYFPLDYAYQTYRGTMAHKFLEDGVHEEDARIERTIEVDIALPDGSVVLMRSTPDKVVPSLRLLIDYKTINDKNLAKVQAGTPKGGWAPQLSVYRWMLAQHGVPIDRALIQMFSNELAERVPVELWTPQKTEAYLLDRLPQFAPIYNGGYWINPTDVEDVHIPPRLDPVLDSDQSWKCHHIVSREGVKPPWCPVWERCEYYAKHGV